MTKYTAQLVEGKIILYRLSDDGEVIGYAKIYPLIEEPLLLLEIDFYNTDGLLVETANEGVENFGVSSFEQLAKLPPDKLGLMIWGD